MIVGDTTKIPFVYHSIQNAFDNIMGSVLAKERMIQTDPSRISSTSSGGSSMIASSTELNAIGAASMLPSYSYSIPDGQLVRTK
jgi:hypothetical protein